MTSVSFLDSLDEKQLLNIWQENWTSPSSASERKAITERYGEDTFDQIGTTMYVETAIAIQKALQGVGGPFIDDFWFAVKEEIHDLICKNGPKYRGLRRKISGAGGVTQQSIVALIAAALSARVGLGVGALVPFVALCLAAVARIGTNAFCKSRELNIPIKKPRARRLKK